jgi:AraC-type transcriptional regulator
MSGLMTLGYDPAPFLHAQGIDTKTLLDPDARVPMSACVGLLADGVRATGDDNLGLHVAEHAELGTFDVHFYAMTSDAATAPRRAMLPIRSVSARWASTSIRSRSRWRGPRRAIELTSSS